MTREDYNLEKIADSSARIADALEELVQLQKAEYVELKNKLNNSQEDKEE